MQYVLGFVLSFLAIFLKSCAQQNVQFRRKKLIVPTSILLAVCEMFTAGVFVNNFLTMGIASSIILALFIGVGGGLGSIISLDFHRWLTKKLYKWNEVKSETKEEIQHD